jgi:hypothetical protein
MTLTNTDGDPYKFRIVFFIKSNWNALFLMPLLLSGSPEDNKHGGGSVLGRGLPEADGVRRLGS